jgi:hypothetical protein
VALWPSKPNACAQIAANKKISESLDMTLVFQLAAQGDGWRKIPDYPGERNGFDSIGEKMLV